MTKLLIVSVISFVFTGVEVAGGYYSGSIAIFTDAAHLCSDVLGFAISMIALKLAQRDATDNMSFGRHRYEIFGTLISV